MSDLVDLALFPLGLVLFPSQVLPLHIFEERYKLMIGECLRGDMTFGVVLIKQGAEVGAPALPFEVGTAAKIVDMQSLGQGRMGLQTVGLRPFRVAQVTRMHPYMRANVEFLDYSKGDQVSLNALAVTVKEQFLVHLTILANLTEKPVPPLELSVDPELLSFLVASTMIVDPPEKQKLLEIPRADERLKAIATILARENKALQNFVHLSDQTKREPPGSDALRGRFSPN